MFENNPLPMWVYDVGTLEFLEVNHAAVESYGYTRDEFLRLRVTDERPPERDGHVRDVDVTSRLIDFDGHQAALVVATDVTERRQAEVSLAKSTERLEILHTVDRALIAAESPGAIAEIVLARLRDLLEVPRAI